MMSRLTHLLRTMTDMKDWTGNGKSTFVTLGASNHTDKEREKHDFYATDPIAIDKLFGCPVCFNIPDIVWECACGNGCLSERMEYFGRRVYSSDIVDRGYGVVLDFLNADTMPEGCECIITNPPYKYATEFVMHALDLLPNGGWCIMFLKTTFLEGQKRWKEIFSSTPPKYVLQFSQRVLCAKNGQFKRMRDGGGSAVAYAWYVWRKGYDGDTIIRWI